MLSFQRWERGRQRFPFALSPVHLPCPPPHTSGPGSSASLHPPPTHLLLLPGRQAPGPPAWARGAETRALQQGLRGDLGPHRRLGAYNGIGRPPTPAAPRAHALARSRSPAPCHGPARARGAPRSPAGPGAGASGPAPLHNRPDGRPRSAEPAETETETEALAGGGGERASGGRRRLLTCPPVRARWAGAEPAGLSAGPCAARPASPCPVRPSGVSASPRAPRRHLRRRLRDKAARGGAERWLSQEPAGMGAPPAPTHRANLQSDPGKPKAPFWPLLISSHPNPEPCPGPHPLHLPGAHSAPHLLLSTGQGRGGRGELRG